MKVGDLVVVTSHVNEKFLGLITEINSNPRTGHPIDSMFPYFICFINDYGFNDWYGPDSLEVLSESR
tara:strand:- start:50 stop:250 length:201 start_codon:yes stop_codon:yes gene_type:complete